MFYVVNPARPMERVIGTIERVVFKAEDTGYVVLSFLESGKFDAINAVGAMPDAKEGLQVEIDGEWVSHARYGRQLKITSYKVPRPSSEEGILAYLSTLKGLGEKMAQRAYDLFGESVFEVLEKAPDKLLLIDGVGKKKLATIVKSYEETHGLRQIIEFLGEIGVSAGYAPRIYREFGSAAIGLIQGNPYILCDRVRGFGFKKADEVALAIGIEPTSTYRYLAGIKEVLKKAAMDGHCYLPRDQMGSNAASLLALPGITIKIEDLLAVCAKKSTEVKVEGGRAYLRRNWDAERTLSRRVADAVGQVEYSGIDRWLKRYDSENEYPLGRDQRKAVVMAATENMSVLTGSAGCGKSTVAKAIVQLWHEMGLKILQCAPTGKAAQRLKETTGMESSTIHRLLGWSGHSFEHDATNPLECDAIVVDESSMINLQLFDNLFQAIPHHARVLLIGDPFQLPAIGSGDVLRDLIRSGLIPVTNLTETFRQSSDSRIIQVAEEVRNGIFPSFQQIDKNSTVVTDAIWVNCEAAQIPRAVSWLLKEKLPSMGIDKHDVQLLSPMHKTEAGNVALNKLALDIWNPMPVESHADWRVGSRVIQTVNDYNRGVFNGDIGLIEAIATEDDEKVFQIRYPTPESPSGKIVEYRVSEMRDVMLAASVSVHKAQGSEFPVIIVPVTMQHYMMLQRNLLYTGITRGKKMVILVGEKRAIDRAVRNNPAGARNTALVSRLAGRLNKQMEMAV